MIAESEFYRLLCSQLTLPYFFTFDHIMRKRKSKANCPKIGHFAELRFLSLILNKRKTETTAEKLCNHLLQEKTLRECFEYICIYVFRLRD